MRERLRPILTVDHRAFEAYRIGRSAKFRILPADEPHWLGVALGDWLVAGTGELMQQSRLRSWIWGPLSAYGGSVAGITLLLDQVSKWWVLVVYSLEERGRVHVTPFLDFVFVKNFGISYGLFPLEG